MHTRLLICLCFFYSFTLLTSYGQKANAPQKIVIDSTGADFTYTEIREVAKTKAKILEAVQLWAAKKYDNHLSALVNKSTGSFVLKTQEALPAKNTYLKFTISIDCKEKKYRAILSDIKVNYQNDFGQTQTVDWKIFKTMTFTGPREKLIQIQAQMQLDIILPLLNNAIIRNNTDF